MFRKFTILFIFLLNYFIACQINWENPESMEAIDDLMKTLPSPSSISIEDRTVSWKAVEGASGYIVYIDEDVVLLPSTVTKYTLPESYFSANVALKALGDGLFFRDSTRSFYLTFTGEMPFIEESENTEPPTPLLPIPTEAQLNWQKLEQYAFIHFGPNTFRNAEWGEGKPYEGSAFRPTQDVDKVTTQWADKLSERGMKALILTVKHHDGFCLWDSEATDYSVNKTDMYSGDITGKLVEKLKTKDMKLGLYLSPWDRNNWAYLHPEYVDIFTKQTEEITTKYGEIFEVWFDGANDTSGWYGGGDYSEIRDSLKDTPYVWFQKRKASNTGQLFTRETGQLEEGGPIVSREYYLAEMKNRAIEIIRKNQPNAVVFGDNSGRGVRWVGNEEGWAGRTCWSMGYSMYGDENGDKWFPAECDMKTRSGWFHSTASTSTRPYQELLEFWYRSVGRNATLLLNFSPGRDGLIPENSLEEARKMWKQVSEDFKTNLAVEENIQSVEASDIRGDAEEFSPKQLFDGDFDTYWTVNNNTTSGSVTIQFKNKITFDRILLQEYVALGQRVKSFSVEVKNEAGEWVSVILPNMPYAISSHKGETSDPDTTTTIGYKRILRTAKTTTDAFRLTINQCRRPVPFLISELGLYKSYEGSLD